MGGQAWREMRKSLQYWLSYGQLCSNNLWASVSKVILWNYYYAERSVYVVIVIIIIVIIFNVIVVVVIVYL